MYTVCEEKFKQEPFKTLLMRTGESILIEKIPGAILILEFVMGLEKIILEKI